MQVKPITRTPLRTVARLCHMLRRLPLMAGLAAMTPAIACLAVVAASAAPGRQARSDDAGRTSAATAMQAVSCGPPGYFIQCYTP